MDQKPKEKKYLEISPEELERINLLRNKEDNKLKIDQEQLFIAEFGKHYGYDGIKAILNNDIDGETATWLLQAARKIDYGRLYDAARASLIGGASAQTKKPGETFKKATKELQKAMKADV